MKGTNLGSLASQLTIESVPSSVSRFSLFYFSRGFQLEIILSFFLPFFFSFDFSSINAMEIGRAWSSVSISRKNFSLWFLFRILGGIPHKEQCGFEFLQGTRIVNHGRYFLYGESKMRSSFIRSVYLLCRFVKIAVQRHGYLNLHEAFPFPSEYSVNTSYIYISIKRDVPWIEYQFYLHFLNMFILCRLCALRNVVWKHSSFE